MASIIVYMRPDWTIADPICTFMFSILVLSTTFPIVRDCVHIIMEATPKDVNYKLIWEDIAKLRGVITIHDLHIWSLTSGKISLSAHIDSIHPQISLQQVQRLLRIKFGIFHSTI